MDSPNTSSEGPADHPTSLPAEDHFRDVQKYYKRFYSSTDLHYAHWDPTTKSSKEAIQNTNRTVCELLQIQRGDSVLDAGCGPGGTAVYIAGRYGARVEGIDVSQVHIERARENAASEGVLNLVNFSLQDHRHTDFRAAQFDHVIAIESVLASDSATPFLREAHRVLKPGGKIVVMTMHLARSSGGMAVFKRRHAGHAAFEVNRSKDEFCAIIKQAGFRDIRVTDMTGRIRLASRTLLAVPLFCMLTLSKLGLVNTAMGAHLQTLLETERAIAKGKAGMAAFVAER